MGALAQRIFRLLLRLLEWQQITADWIHCVTIFIFSELLIGI